MMHELTTFGIDLSRTNKGSYALLIKTHSRRVVPAADVASPSLAGHIFGTTLHP